MSDLTDLRGREARNFLSRAAARADRLARRSAPLPLASSRPKHANVLRTQPCSLHPTQHRKSSLKLGKPSLGGRERLASAAGVTSRSTSAPSLVHRWRSQFARAEAHHCTLVIPRQRCDGAQRHPCRRCELYCIPCEYENGAPPKTAVEVAVPGHDPARTGLSAAKIPPFTATGTEGMAQA